jgi:hypothetical protein
MQENQGKSGIYKCGLRPHNEINGKIYIGSAVNIPKRLSHGLPPLIFNERGIFQKNLWRRGPPSYGAGRGGCCQPRLPNGCSSNFGRPISGGIGLASRKHNLPEVVCPIPQGLKGKALWEPAGRPAGGGIHAIAMPFDALVCRLKF